jgi:N-methylhydantoinase A
MNNKSQSYRIGADVGGTFTDIVLMDERGYLWTHKAPSTSPNYEQAILDAMPHLLRAASAAGQEVTEMAHGTTVATNAVLEGRGAHTALITTRGFRDVLELRRIRAPQMYDLFFEKPKTLVDRYLRLELNERMSASGETLRPVDRAELRALAEKLVVEGVESVAVCFLHAYAYPQHEQIVGDFLRQHLGDVPISLSHQVLPERREYERTATTVVNAYVQPVMERYLQALREGLHRQDVHAPLLIMQSGGGLTPAADAARLPVYALESGPAAGVLGAGVMAHRSGIDNVIAFDMGGTTAKAALIEKGRIAYSAEYEVGASLSAGNRLVGGGGELIRAPSIDIAEVGAGGGSIAFLDRAGGLRVGPRSAGAAPGPVCYGRGGVEPTVTDANVVLGCIPEGELADGEVRIDAEAAHRAIHDHIAAPLGLSLLQAADGIHRIANSRMMRALRAVSTERGRDPREFVLFAFGGSGPVHAAGIARDMVLQRTLIPPLPGLFSAVGLLFAGIEHHNVRSCSLVGAAIQPQALRTIGGEMQARMAAQFQREGFRPDAVTFHFSADVRYQGQASEIRLPLPERQQPFCAETVAALAVSFEAEHERLYGHRSDADELLEIVAVRLVGRVAGENPLSAGQNSIGELHVIRRGRRGTGASTRQVYFGERWGLIDTPVIGRAQLTASPTAGPLLIDEYDSTTVVPPDMYAHLDALGSIILYTK